MHPVLTETTTVVPSILREYDDVTRVALARYLGQRPPERHLYGLVARDRQFIEELPAWVLERT
jgi:hypothetical protein